MKATSWLVLAEVALWSSGMLIAEGSNEVVLNEDIEVLHAERMSYPLAGRVHVIEGAVVVKVELGKDGIVHHATAVSGPKLLINDCLKNAKEWRFKRVGHGTAFIVYVFQIKGLCELPCSSNFEFYAPNVALINMGSPIATP